MEEKRFLYGVFMKFHEKKGNLVLRSRKGKVSMQFYRYFFGGLLMIILFDFSAGCSNNKKIEDYSINEEVEYQGEENTEKKQDEINDEITSTSSKDEEQSLQSQQYSAETSESSLYNETISVQEDFLVGSTSVTINAAIPNSWNYQKWDVEKGIIDWGIEIQVEGDENSIIMISGQYGTLNVSSLYPDEPETFVTDQGIEAQYYKDEYRTSEGEAYVNQHIVIGQLNSGFYGISIQMPKKNFDENAESIQELIKSVEILEN